MTAPTAPTQGLAEVASTNGLARPPTSGRRERRLAKARSVGGAPMKLGHRLLWQFAIAAVFLAAWELLPKVPWLADRFKFLNSFFISSPTAVADRLWALVSGNGVSSITLWPYLRTTLYSAIVGVLIGLFIGALLGLVFSNSPRLTSVVRPFIVLLNAIPRIALIPIFVVLYGPTDRASIMSVVFIVGFLAFFNAFEGGRSIRPHVIQNAALLGASQWDIMRTIRLPQVVNWTFAVVPNAIAFGVVGATTTELITGARGMGTLLSISLQLADAGLTFAVIVVLSFAGLALYMVSVKLRDLVMRWENDEAT